MGSTLQKRIKGFLQDAFYEQLGGVMVEEGSVTIDEETQNEIDKALNDYSFEVADGLSGIVYDFYDGLDVDEEVE